MLSSAAIPRWRGQGVEFVDNPFNNNAIYIKLQKKRKKPTDLYVFKIDWQIATEYFFMFL